MTRMPGPIPAIEAKNDRRLTAASTWSNEDCFSRDRDWLTALYGKTRSVGRSGRIELLHRRFPAVAEPPHDRVLLRQRLGNKDRRVDDAVSEDVRAGVEHL